MVGRGAQGRPWLPRQISAALAGQEPPAIPEGEDLAALVIEHHAMMREHYGEPLGIRMARKHVSWYLEPCEVATGSAHPLRQALMTANEVAVIEDLIWRAFSAPLLENVA
jgi:tRNA-dihydrouridine synthase B